jgi:hypothetical protein
MSMKTKERPRNRPPLTPPYPRRGIPGLPFSGEEGLGVVGLCVLGVKRKKMFFEETSYTIYGKERS